MRAIPVPTPSSVRVSAPARKCRLCQEPVPHADRTCLHCGAVLIKTKPREEELTPVGGLGVMLGVFIALLALWGMFFKGGPDDAGGFFFMVVIGCCITWVSWNGARRVRPDDA